jgi:glucose/arabinose dehydrogenase
MVIRQFIFGLLLTIAALCSWGGEDEYYKVESFNEEGLTLEVSGITQLSDGRMMICTRRGEIFIVEDAYQPEKAQFKPWAFGLSHPLGLLEHKGWIYCMQRGELTRMRDASGDGRADVFETVSDWIPISGNYHEYNFGPRLDKEGKLWITTNKPFGGEPYGRAGFRGWAIRYDPETGKHEYMACGLRSPAGLEISPEGDVFYTDNQGEWCNASKLSHIEKNDFHGHPHGIESAKEEGVDVDYPGNVESGHYMKDLKKSHPTFKMPAVWFPYGKIGKSPAGMAWDTSGGRFGPFAGQLFVGDQNQSCVMRVMLEKVDGHWQGACIRWREGLGCGVIRVAFGKDDSMFVGMTNAGWGSVGSLSMGFKRISWTGKLPFEIKSMQARPDGFKLIFTKPVDPASVADLAEYKMSSYTYKLEGRYGGPEQDTQDVPIAGATLNDDKLSVTLNVDGLRAGYVHELKVSGVKSADGLPLLHDTIFYTLVNIPAK